MTEIYRPTTNRILNIREKNTHYWNCLVNGSKKYEEVEIVETLEDAEKVNDEWCTFQKKVWEEVLTDDDGEMGGLDGYASEGHREVGKLMFNHGYVFPSGAFNGQYSLPVRRWQKEIKALRRGIKRINRKIEGLIDELNCTCTTYEWDLHSCPYQVEINDNHEHCTCCPFCEQQCNDDI